MKGKQLTFYATNNDILKVMTVIEFIYEIEYIRMGMFDSGNIIRFKSIREITDVGYTSFGNWISADNRFMIIGKNEEVNIRKVLQRNGQTKFIIDPMKNPISIELSTGGIYTKKDGVLIAGRLAYVGDSDFQKNLFKFISKEIRKQFRKVDTEFVGNEAEEKLISGWRLVTAEKSPKKYDLVIGNSDSRAHDGRGL